jgi:hypothetical protein
MTFEQVQQVVKQYMELLDQSGVKSKMHLTSGIPSTGDAWSHARWTCEEISKMTDLEKAIRWLGFVQGVLWATGRRTIDKMREDNRVS